MRCTLGVNWYAQNAGLWCLHVSPHADSTWCHVSQHFLFTAYLAPEKAGLAQKNFSCVCDACQFLVTRESLALAKLVSDLVKDPKNANDVVRFGDAVYLP